MFAPVERAKLYVWVPKTVVKNMAKNLVKNLADTSGKKIKQYSGRLDRKIKKKQVRYLYQA